MDKQTNDENNKKQVVAVHVTATLMAIDSL